MLLIVLLVFVLMAKILVLTSTELPAYDSYFGMRQVEHIQSTGLFLAQDNLSYQGRTNTLDFLPYYLLTALTLLIPINILFLIGGVLVGLASLVLIFLISQKLYANRWIAIIVTTLGALSSVLFSHSLATLTATSFFLLAYLGILYMFITLAKNEQHVLWFVLLAILGTLLHALMLVLVLGFIIYFILLSVENLKLRPKELEVLSFTGLFSLWYHLIVYRKLFQIHGAQMIWASMPEELAQILFQKLSIPLVVAWIGVLPFLLGLYAIYQALFIQRKRYLVFITALTISFATLLFFGILPLTEGLLFTTVNFIILSGFAIKQINVYFNKVHFSKIKYGLVSLLMILALINFIPILFSGLNINAPTMENAQLLQEAKLPEDATILGHVNEGQFISYYTQRKNFYDTRFVLAPQAQQRYNDAQTIFLSTSKTKTLSLLNYYGVRYIYLSEQSRKEHEVTSYLFENDPCFKEIGNSTTAQLYEVRCTISN